MLIRFFISLLVLALALLAVALMLPARVHVERTITVERPPAIVFGLLNNFQHFQAWSPWSERDPNARYTFSGPDRGEGAKLAWSGDPRQVGEGWQQITASQPYSTIRTHLDFGSQGEADAYFDISPVGRATRLEWGFDSDVTRNRGFFEAILGKYMGLLFDYWIGNDYEHGLERFKEYAESFPDADYSDLDIETVETSAEPILFISTSSGQSETAVANALGAAYGQISRFMASRGLAHTAHPLSISHSRSDAGYEFDAAIPIGSTEVRPDGNIQFGYTPSGRAIRVVHKGPYARLGQTYDKIAAYLAVNRLEPSGISWEQYVSDPGETPADELITHIYFQLDE